MARLETGGTIEVEIMGTGPEGASAYQQAIRGGYTGTEEQFNAELANFKNYATSAASSATAAAGSEANAGASAEEAASSAARAGSAASGAATAKDAAETAQRAAESAAETATTQAGLASVSARSAASSATDAAASATAAAGSASQASAKAVEAAQSATAAASSAADAAAAKTAAQSAQTAAETAQSAAEDAKEAAEDAAKSISAAAVQIETNRDAISDLESDMTTKANTDGYYEDLTVGNAEQLVASQFVEDSEPYLFRTSGGTADIGNREEDRIVGGTIAWNQLLSESNLNPYGTTIKTITPQKVVLTPNGTYSGTLHYGASIKSGSLGAIPLNHVLFVCVDCASTKADKFRVRIGNTMFWSASVSANTTVRINSIAEFVIRTLTVYAYDDTLYSTTDEITFQNWNIFDLTQMFGSTIADYIYSIERTTPGAGVAWFRKLFPKDYYEYNSGELLSVEGLTAHKTVGFNLFDADTIMAAHSAVQQSDGSWYVANPASFSRKTAWKNNCGYQGRICITYEYKYNSGSSSGVRFVTRYADGTYQENYVSPSTEFKKATFITGVGKAVDRIEFTYGSRTVATWLKDICINLSWSGTRDGEYEPYVERSYPLDSTLTLRGIPKLDADNALYYDGDTYESDGTVTRRYGVVDLGTLEWVLRTEWSDRYVYEVSVRSAKYGMTLMLCPKYPTYYGARATAPDKTVFKENLIDSFTLMIRDDSYTDAASFKTAMSGVMLVYELETPATETAAPYQNPQIVDDWGTEEYVTASIVPVGHETKYPANLRDKLQHLPNLAGADGYYMIQQTGTQMSLVLFRIPQASGLTDGTYTLKATVSGGIPTYTWEAEQ